MSDPELNGRMVRFFMRHTVAVSLSYKLPDGSRRATAFIAIVIAVEGCWFLLTAGHILKEVYRDLPKCSDVRCVLFDAWGQGTERTPAPFDIMNATHFEIDEDGADVGLMLLPEMHRRLLEANKVQAFAERDCCSPSGEINGYAVVGLPDELITGTDGAGPLGIEPALIPADRIPPPPEIEKKFASFYGKIPDSVFDATVGKGLDSIKGFSGGPILGFRREGEDIRYFLVAVQSAWRKILRITYGPLALEILSGLRMHLKDGTE